ncbi:hypothetical protein [Plesiocystis pacifica]|uniref:hypothetical protein n=1 Tax=Plesiocystis pacifica TaxID=191768 RepID=UPI0012F8C349|nr:hypothetical protein [Plesiocystis pacifica]
MSQFASERLIEKAAERNAQRGVKGESKRMRWLLGWVIIPGSLLGLLFAWGVHVGARHPDMWLARALSWMFG